PGAPEWQRTTGKPMNSNYLVYLYDGVFKDQADIDATLAQIDYSNVVREVRPGDMKYVDFDGDKKITDKDRVRRTRNNIPRFQGGLNINATYKNFDLTILFQGSTGAEQYISTGESGNIGNYLLDVYENRWTIDNPSDKHPRIANRNDQYFSGGNTYWLRNRDYLRLKNLELGYTIPNSLSSKIGMGHARIYVNGLNLFTLAHLKVYDPESDNATGQYYPQARILNAGLSVTF
ncbi:MAG: SusC/RagA family TonB-linked outer membrane protein, partial [Spirosomataceae bacterium]